MIPKIVHFTVPQKLTPPQSEAIATARRMLLGWDVKVWQDPVEPSGFELGHLWSLCNSGAQLADLLRIEVVYKHGGIYLDSDIILERSLDPLAEHYEFFVCTENGAVATNAAFGATARHPLLRRMMDAIGGGKMDWSMPPNQTTGPVFFSRILAGESRVSFLPRQAFYPYAWNEPRCPPHPASYGVHVWAGSWKQDGLEQKIRTLVRRWRPRQLKEKLVNTLAERVETSPWLMRRGARGAPIVQVGRIVLRKTMHGAMLAVPVHNDSRAALIALSGFSSLGCELLLRRKLRGGDHVVEYCDSVSTFAVPAASRVGVFGRVWSITSSDAAYAALKISIEASGYGDRINPVHADLAMRKRRSTDLDSLYPANLPINTVIADPMQAEAVIIGARRLLSSKAIDRVILPNTVSNLQQTSPKLVATIAELLDLCYQFFQVEENGEMTPLDFQKYLGFDQQMGDVAIQIRKDTRRRRKR